MDNFSSENTDQEVADILRMTPTHSPEDSVKNIERATRAGVHPDEYVKMKEDYDPEFDIQDRVPASVDPVITRKMSESSEDANLIKEDLGLWGEIKKRVDYIGYNLLGKRELETEITKLQIENWRSETPLSEDKQEFLQFLKEQRQSELEPFEDLGTTAEVVGQGVGVVGDMVQTIFDNKLEIASITAAGSVIPGVGTGVAFSAATTAAFMADAYKKTSAATFDEISNMTDEEGKPLNLPRNQVNNISTGVGAAAGALEAITGKFLTKGLGKLIKPKDLVKMVVKSPAKVAMMNAFGEVSKTAIASGGEEVSAEIASILGENYARGALTEEGLFNAIVETTKQIGTDKETQKRLGMTLLVGAVASGGITGVTGAATFKRNVKAIENNNQFIEERTIFEEKNKTKLKKVNETIKVIEAQNDFLNTAHSLSQAKINELSPEKRGELLKDMFDSNEFEGKVHFNQSDLDMLAKTDPELLAKMRELDITESTESETESGLALDPHRFLELVTEAPSLTEFMRMNPTAPNPLESKVLLKKLKETEAKKQAIFEAKGVEGELTPEQIKTLDELDAEVEATLNDGLDGYIDDFKPSPVLNLTLNKEKGGTNFLSDQGDIRLEVANIMVDKFNRDERLIENRIIKANDKILLEQQLRDNKEANEVLTKFKPVGDQTHSDLAIDLKKLSPELREKYGKDKKLRSRKVFKKDGMSLEESAALAGFKSGEELLQVLSETPNKNDLFTARQDTLRKIRKQVKEVREKSYEDRLNKVFDQVVKLHAEEMKVIKKNKWGVFKSGLRDTQKIPNFRDVDFKNSKRVINLPDPILAELNNKARSIVKKTKVGNISPKQFNAAERVLQKRYLDHMMNNEVEQGYATKEKVILNAELTRESLKAKKRIGDAKTFVKRLTNKRTQKMLKKSGLDVQVNELLDIFDIDPSKRKRNDRQANYFEHLARLEANGESIIVPDTLTDVRQRGADMTVDQYLMVIDKLRHLEHQAKLVNKLTVINDKREKANKLNTLEAVSNDLSEDLVLNHPKHDSSKTAEDVDNPNSKGLRQWVGEKLSLGGASFTNFKNIFTELDQEALNGVHYDTVVNRMVERETFKRERLSGIVDQIKAIGEQYGDKDFKAAFNEFVTIEEFKGYKALGNGKMAKSDLWTLLAYMGDPDALNRMENFKHSITGDTLSSATIMQALESSLNDKDALLVQNFANIFKSFESEAKDLHLRSTGVEPTMIVGVPFTFKGKVYEGGYIPNNYLNNTTEQRIKQFQEIMGEKSAAFFGETDGRIIAQMRAAEQTDQGRLIQRKGSNSQLDTDFRKILQSFEEHVHDVAYREAGLDTLKILKDKTYKMAIIDTVGEAKYNTAVSAVIETVGKADNTDNNGVFGAETKFINDMFKAFEQNFAVNALGGNLKSVAMQPLSLGTAALRMGPKGKRYLAKAVGVAIQQLLTGKYNSEYFNRAIEVNNDLKTNRDGIDDTLTSSTFDHLDVTTNLPPKLRGLKNLRKKYVEKMMIGLSTFDLHLKAATSLAAHAQFINGDVKNFDNATLASMSQADIDVAAKKYVKQLSDLALTTSATIDKSAVEKITQMRMFTRFYTDVRSQLNTGLSQGRKIRNATSQGDYKSAMRDAGNLYLVYTLNKLYVDLLYQEEENIVTEFLDIRDFDDVKSFALSAALGPASVFTGSIPVVRDIQFAAQSYSSRKDVNTWLGRALTDVTMGGLAVYDYVTEGETSDSREKGFYNTGSAVTGIPTKKIRDYYEFISDETGVDPVELISDQMSRTSEAIIEYILKNEGDPSKAEEIEALKEYQGQIAPQDVQGLVPENTIESLKLNSWQDVNPDTGAAGVFQFTEARWEEISEEAEDLELSEEGRISKDDSEQVKAMEWSLEQNARTLNAFGMETTTDNLYGTHRFGADDFTAILFAKDSDKLEGIVSDMGLFKGFKTVKQVKDFIAKQVKNVNN